MSQGTRMNPTFPSWHAPIAGVIATVLVGCADAPPSSLTPPPDALSSELQAPPLPTWATLSPTEFAYQPGETAVFNVVGPPNAYTLLFWSDQGLGTSPPLDILGQRRLGILPPAVHGGLEWLGATDASGATSWSAPVPSTVANGLYGFQAAFRSRNGVHVAGSNPQVVAVGTPAHADCAGDDAFEPNDGAFDNLPVIDLDQSEHGVLRDLVLCPSDPFDVFQLTGTPTHDLYVNLSFLHAEGNVDVYLLQHPGGLGQTLDLVPTLGLGAATSDSSDERLAFTGGSPLHGDPVWLVVHLKEDHGASVGTTYDLFYDVFNADAECHGDDAFEPNSGPLAAADLTPGTYTNLATCTRDFSDGYRVELQAGDSVTATVSAHPSNPYGHYDVWMYTQMDAPPAATTSHDPLSPWSTTLTYTATTSGAHYLIVRDPSQPAGLGPYDPTYYDLTLSITAP